MASAKLFFLTALVAVMAASVAGQDAFSFFPKIVTEFWSSTPTAKEAYRFEQNDPTNGATREEMGMILNPGTDNEELVVMGMYTTYDEKTGIETTTMYTADKDGYKPRYSMKNRKLSPGALKSAAG